MASEGQDWSWLLWALFAVLGVGLVLGPPVPGEPEQWVIAARVLVGWTALIGGACGILLSVTPLGKLRIGPRPLLVAIQGFPMLTHEPRLRVKARMDLEGLRAELIATPDGSGTKIMPTPIPFVLLWDDGSVSRDLSDEAEGVLVLGGVDLSSSPVRYLAGVQAVMDKGYPVPGFRAEGSDPARILAHMKIRFTAKGVASQCVWVEVGIAIKYGQVRGCHVGEWPDYRKLILPKSWKGLGA